MFVISMFVLVSLPTIELAPLNIFHSGVQVFQQGNQFVLVSWQDATIAVVDKNGNKIGAYTAEGQGPDALTVPIIFGLDKDGVTFVNAKQSFVRLSTSTFQLEHLDLPPLARELSTDLFDIVKDGDHLHLLNSSNELTGLLYQTVPLKGQNRHILHKFPQSSPKPETIHLSNDTFFFTRFQLNKGDDQYSILVYQQLPKSLREDKPHVLLSGTVSDKLAPHQWPFKALVNKVCILKDHYVAEISVKKGPGQHDGYRHYWDYFDQSGQHVDRVFMDDAAMVPIQNGPGGFIMQGDYEYLHPVSSK